MSTGADVADAWYGRPIDSFAPVAGGICAVPGVRAAGVAAGLKPSGSPDVAVVDAGRTVDVAVVQTTNQVRAAPVEVTARHAADGRARAVVLNAGNANACTGPDGEQVAVDTAAHAAAGLGCETEDVLVCSTGVIGQPLTPQRGQLFAGVDAAIATADSGGGAAAARAVMTTDTMPKSVAVQLDAADGGATIAGFAKGSGMIAPAMATMLCVAATDAPVPSRILQPVVAQAVDVTFGRITVDGCMSTNDAVIVLATGDAAQAVPHPPARSARPRPAPGIAAFTEGLTAVLGELAEQIVRDGEGASHLVRLRVTGARTVDAAAALGRAIADSVLVRTAFAGGDPNWGRVLAAMGASDVPFSPGTVDIRFGPVTVCRFGAGASFDHGLAASVLSRPEVDVTVDLGLGDADATVLTSDLTHGYVTINAEYTT
ncbi:MAG TPA: bifunctional glutamate N-acetyltransferase/amino-acid acetyltransferase ArgJ [Euzebyales bacterium]